jgi:hypothetical protein
VLARRAFAIAALIVAALLSGCGGRGDVKQANAYVAAVNQAQTRFAGTIAHIADGLSDPADRRRTRRAVDGFGTAVDTVVVDLRGIDAPPRVRSLHGELVGEMAGFGKAVRRAGRGLRARDPVAVLEERTRLLDTAQRTVRAINATIARINHTLRS